MSTARSLMSKFPKTFHVSRTQIPSKLSKSPLSLMPRRFVASSNIFRQQDGQDKPESQEKPEVKEEKVVDPLVQELQKSVEDLKTQLTAKDKKIAELQDAYLRQVAEVENVRARGKRETEEAKQFAMQKFAKDLLDTADVLQMALEATPKDAIPNSKHLQDLHTGVSMTLSNLLSAFRRFTIEPFDPMGEKFDPNLHQAMFQAPVPDKEPGTVFSVQKTGYMIGSRVLRPAQVGVVMEKPE